MAQLAPQPLALRDWERNELKKLVNRHSTPQQIVLRAKIIRLTESGNNNRDLGRKLDITRQMARRWRNRWLELSERELPVIERLLWRRHALSLLVDTPANEEFDAMR